METEPSEMYRKSGNFHVKIIHVLNIHFGLFSWVYDNINFINYVIYRCLLLYCSNYAVSML